MRRKRDIYEKENQSNHISSAYGSYTWSNSICCRDRRTNTFEVLSENYCVDDEEVYIDIEVNASLSLISGFFTVPMSSDADLYFSSLEPVYVED